MPDTQKPVVMISGATGNLGHAVARKFLEKGAHLSLIDRGEDELQGSFPDLAGSDDHYLGNCADLTHPQDVGIVVQQTIDYFKRIDILIHTVGGYQAGNPLHETSLDTWNFMIDLNASSTFIICHAVIPHMLEKGFGKIVTIGARPGLKGSGNASAYSAAKGAVIRLTESMSAEYRHQGININCIIPGTLDTPQNRDAMLGEDYDRWVEPESLAGVILFLTSETARDIHGAIIPVYGRT